MAWISASRAICSRSLSLPVRAYSGDTRLQALMLEHQFVAQRLVAGRGKAGETVVKRRVAHADLSNSTVVAPASWSIQPVDDGREDRAAKIVSCIGNRAGLAAEPDTEPLVRTPEGGLDPTGRPGVEQDRRRFLDADLRVLDRFHIEEFAGNHRSGEPQHTKVGGVGRHRDDDRFVGNGWGGGGDITYLQRASASAYLS